MTTQELLALYQEAWSWGYRCETTNQGNYKYVKEAIEARQKVLTELEKRSN